MDVCNEDAQIETGICHWTGGVILGFKQDPRQKNWRGIIVNNPRAARRYATMLLNYADNVDPPKKKAPRKKKAAKKKKTKRST